MTGSIIVCPLSKLPESLESSGAKRLVSLLSRDTQFERLENITQANHLILRFNDIVEPRAGLIAPSKKHIVELIDFANGWDQTTPMLIHCWAGISRSPAAAAIVALALTPSMSDGELAINMRALSPSITPNIMMIDIADKVLQRGGQFSKAVRAIGRGEDAFEGNLFEIHI